MKTKLTACLRDGVGAWWGVWRSQACQNSSGGLLKVQRDKLGAITARCFLDMAAATSCFTNWLGSISESTNGHGPNQSEDVLLFRQRGQSESQLSRMLSVILQISNQCSQVCTTPCWGTTSHPWNMACLGWEGRQLPPPPNSSHLGLTCPRRKLPVLLRIFPLLQVSYHDCLQRSSVLQKISADATELSDGSDSPADCNIGFLVPWVISQKFRKKGVPYSTGYCHYAAQSGTVMKCSFFNNRVPMKLWEDTEADGVGRSGLGFLSARYPELCE